MTAWNPPTTTPAAPGMYTRDFARTFISPSPELLELFCRWDGQQWFRGYQTLRPAQLTQSPACQRAQALPWREIEPASEPADAKTTKQRTLTSQQRKLLEHQQAGKNDHAIARELGVHVNTVRLKRTALKKGIGKGAYSDLGSLGVADTRTLDLFTGVTA